MMKLTLYVESYDRHTEAHIDHLENERKGVGSALNKLVLDVLSDPAKLKDVLSAFGIGGSRPYRENDVASLDFPAGGTRQPADLPADVSSSPAPAAPEAPSPSAMASDTEAAMLKHAALLHEGEGSFDALTRTWVSNYGVENAPQPDRQGALMACFSGHGRAASLYIRERGGLAGACIDAIVRQGLTPADEAVQLGKHVALNMVQVGSALGVPLDTFLERSMFSRELTPEMPEPGMLPPVEFDRSHLPLPSGTDVR